MVRMPRSNAAGSHFAMSFAPIATVTMSGRSFTNRGSWSCTASATVAPDTLRFTTRTVRPVTARISSASTPT